MLAIRHQLHQVVERLCGMGADLSVSDRRGNSPLWVALRSRQETCAEKLVSEAPIRTSTLQSVSKGRGDLLFLGAVFYWSL